jgi:hypothetical protein
MKTRILFLAAFLGACSEEEKNNCDEYVSYMCECVSEAECDELTTLYSDASTEQQNECAIALDEAEAAGGGCDTASTQ